MEFISNLLLVVDIIGVVYFLVEILKQLKSKEFGLDFLAIVAIMATILNGEYLAGLVVVIMSFTGDFLENYAGKRAEKDLKLLLSKVPESARRILENGSVEFVQVDDVQVGDLLAVQVGDVVPLDGILVSENAVLDESSLTGESIHVDKNSSDTILSGSIALTSFKYNASAVASESSYQQIVKLTQIAKGSKAPVVKLANRISLPFTILSLLIAFSAWFISGDFSRFAQVLVLATPCPLLIAAPVAFLAGLSICAKRGIIIRETNTIQALTKVKVAAFDKTGTITKGQLSYERISITEDGVNLGFSKYDVFEFVYALELYSNHILRDSLVNTAKALGATTKVASNVQEIPGVGVRGTVGNQHIRVQKPTTVVTLLSGEMAVEVEVDGVPIAYIFLVDSARDEAKSVVEFLKCAGISHILMLTGDRQETAQYIAQKVGIEDIRSGLLPHQKLEIVKGIKHFCEIHGHHVGNVMVVGDGINDAPVLSLADIGVAIASREKTVASQAADVVIMRDNLFLVCESILISKRTMSIAKQSMIMGIGFSIIFMFIAAFGFIPAVIGAVIQEIIDVIAILNGLRARTLPRSIL
ncbi:MAG: cadmium-translocating P-type ATPase [Candidatus Ancillula sp.]|nr:cadmium-translocating P-type ATPase [Candidatus Ancillula sp.]